MRDERARKGEEDSRGDGSYRRREAARDGKIGGK